MFDRTTRCCLGLMASLNLALAENWPAWRGPRGDGTSLESHVPVHWGAASSIAWKTELPDNGHASPIVWRDRLFTVTALLDSQDRALLCLDRATLRCRDRQIALAGEDGRAPRLIGLGQRAGLFSQRRRSHPHRETRAPIPTDRQERAGRTMLRLAGNHGRPDLHSRRAAPVLHRAEMNLPRRLSVAV